MQVKAAAGLQPSILKPATAEEALTCLWQVSVGDIMLVDGGLSTFKILSKTPRDVHMEVVDGGRMTSRSVTCTTSLTL